MSAESPASRVPSVLTILGCCAMFALDLFVCIETKESWMALMCAVLCGPLAGIIILLLIDEAKR